MKDVAKLAGVSQATVSYALSGRVDRNQSVGEDALRRVLDATRALRYAPNHNARSLRRLRTERVCHVTNGVGIPWADVLTRHLQHGADAAGYSVVTLPTESATGLEHAIEVLHRGLADGAVISSVPLGFDTECLSPLALAGMPLVVFGDHVETAGFDVVRRGEYAACTEALGHLLRQGRRRIAFIAHSTDRDPRAPSPRFIAYRDALERQGPGIDLGLVVQGAEDRVEAYRATAGLLQRDAAPDAIFAGSDRAAISAIWAIRDAGLEVPRQVAVIGVGNIPEGEISRPALTTVGGDMSRLHEVADLLFARLGGADDPPIELALPVRLIRRGSA